MTPRPKSFALLTVLACLAFIECIGQNEKNAWAINVSYEDDALSLNGKQENYTSAFRAELVTSSFRMPRQLFPKLKSPVEVDMSRISFGAYGYTPQNIQTAEIETGDRPYASFAYVGAGRTSYDLEKELVLKSELQVGFLGTGVLEDIQRTMKPLFGQPEPMGWNHQVGYAGSFALNYSASVSKASFHSGQIFLKYFLANLHVEQDSLATDDSELITIDSLAKDKIFMRELSELLVAETGFEFLQTNLKAGVNAGMVADNLYFTLELNLFNFNRHSLFNYIPDRVKAFGPLHDTDHMRSGKDLFRFNFFVRPTFKLVGYNAFLEGAMFNDNSVLVIPHSDIQRALFEIEAGFNFLIAHQFTLTGSWSGRSKEYAGGRPFNAWGGITLGYSPSRWHE